MDWLTFFSKLAESLVWPVMAIVLLLLLRPDVKSLLSVLKHPKAGPVEAEFEREVLELRQEAETELPPVQPPPPVAPERQKLLQLAQINPRSSILEAWKQVEFAGQRLISDQRAGSSAAPSRDFRSQLGLGRALSLLLSPEELGLYHQLLALRNQAAHAEGFEPPPESRDCSHGRDRWLLNRGEGVLGCGKTLMW